jgi:hypothetical protein
LKSRRIRTSNEGVVLNDEENEIAVHIEKNLKGKYIPLRFAKEGLTELLYP